MSQSSITTINLGPAALTGNLAATQQAIAALQTKLPKKELRPFLNRTLTMLVATPHLEIVKTLIAAGASPTSNQNQHLHTALSYGRAQVARYLHDQGAIPRKDERCPILTAATSANHQNPQNRLDCVKLALAITQPIKTRIDYARPEICLAEIGDIASLEAIRTHPNNTYIPLTIPDNIILTALYQSAALVEALKRFGSTFNPNSIRKLLSQHTNSKITHLALDLTKQNFPKLSICEIATEAANKAAASIWLGHQLAA